MLAIDSRGVVAHVATFAPELYRLRGPETVLAVVQQARVRAEHYGFITEGSVQLFIELMLTLGHDFDTDPQLKNVCSPLGLPGDELPRARVLFNQANKYFDRVAGPNNEFTILAL